MFPAPSRVPAVLAIREDVGDLLELLEGQAALAGVVPLAHLPQPLEHFVWERVATAFVRHLVEEGLVLRLAEGQVVRVENFVAAVVVTGDEGDQCAEEDEEELHGRWWWWW